MIKVSIIIPVYNVGTYLRRCLDSLCNQTLKDIEIICVDDCSTDNSTEILTEYAKTDCRVKVISLPKNLGCAVARNKGLEIASGEYLGFVDSDDYIDLDFYENLYCTAKETMADIVKGKRVRINTDEKKTESSLNEEIKRKGKYHFSYEWQTAIYKKSIIDKNKICFPDVCRKAQDSVFLTKAVFYAKHVVLNNKCTYYHVKRKDSLDSDLIPISSIKSAIFAILHILLFINDNLYQTDNTNYNFLYYRWIVHFLARLQYQSKSESIKQLCAKAFIEGFHNCLDKSILEEKLKNEGFYLVLKYAKNKEIKKLTNLLSKYDNFESLYNNQISFFNKIFSIRKSYRKTHIIFNILGTHIKLRTKARL